MEAECLTLTSWEKGIEITGNYRGFNLLLNYLDRLKKNDSFQIDLTQLCFGQQIALRDKNAIKKLDYVECKALTISCTVPEFEGENYQIRLFKSGTVQIFLHLFGSWMMLTRLAGHISSYEIKDDKIVITIP